MRSISYYIGFAAGLLFTLAVIAAASYLIRKKTNPGGEKPQYDERQLAARGSAYRLGYLTLLGTGAVYAVLEGMGLHFCVVPVGIALCAFISLGVFAVTAIRMDAYFAFNTCSRSFTLLYLVIAGLNLIGGCLQHISGGFIQDGLIGGCAINYGMTVLFAVILLTQHLHSRRSEDEQ